jgi:hypothetical protein
MPKEKTFEEIIVENCSFRQKTLLRPAKIAAQAPDTGVEIKSKSAYHVIKDCADLAIKYLPIYAWSWYEDPVTELKDKMSEKAIRDFIKRVSNKTDENYRPLQHLLDVVVTSIKNTGIVVPETVSNSISDDIDDIDDIYGDYDFDVPQAADSEVLDDEALLLKWISKV